MAEIDDLRRALEATWRETLRSEPRVARLLLRRLIGALEMWNAAVPSAEWTEWEASPTPALLEGLAAIQVVASPTGTALLGLTAKLPKKRWTLTLSSRFALY